MECVLRLVLYVRIGIELVRICLLAFRIFRRFCAAVLAIVAVIDFIKCCARVIVGFMGFLFWTYSIVSIRNLDTNIIISVPKNNLINTKIYTNKYS